MGIIKTATDDLTAAFTAFKGGKTRNQKRAYVAALVNAGNEWLAKFDAQESSAPKDFAATRAAQFNTFTDALADPALNPVDPAL